MAQKSLSGSPLFLSHPIQQIYPQQLEDTSDFSVLPAYTTPSKKLCGSCSQRLFTAMDSMTSWNSCKLPKPTTFLLVASVRISHPQQFCCILFNLHRELDVQVSNLRSALSNVLASSFLLGGIWREKSSSLPIWHYWVLISRGCPGKDEDLTEMGTVQK